MVVKIAFGLFVAGVVAVDAIMAHSYGRLIGHDEMSRAVYGAVGVLAVLAKSLAGVLLLAAVANRAWSSVLASVAIIAVTVTYSVMGGIGYSGHSRGAAAAPRAEALREVARIESEISAAKRAADVLPASRPERIVLAAISAEQNLGRQANSRTIAELRVEYATAKERTAQLDAIAAMSTQLSQARSKVSGNINAADPAATAIASALGVQDETVSRLLPISVVTLIEVLSLLGAVAVRGAGKQAQAPMAEQKLEAPARPDPPEPKSAPVQFVTHTTEVRTERKEEPAEQERPALRVVASSPVPMLSEERRALLQEFVNSRTENLAYGFESTAAVAAEVSAHTGQNFDARVVGAFLSENGYRAVRRGGVRGFEGIAVKGERAHPIMRRRA